MITPEKREEIKGFAERSIGIKDPETVIGIIGCEDNLPDKADLLRTFCKAGGEIDLTIGRSDLDGILRVIMDDGALFRKALDDGDKAGAWHMREVARSRIQSFFDNLMKKAISG